MDSSGRFVSYAAAAEPRAMISRGGLAWALEGIVCQHLTVARIAEGLGTRANR